jgi:hypothetical protein
MIERQDIRKRTGIPKLIPVLPPESYPLGVQDYLGYANIKLLTQKILLSDKIKAAVQNIENWTGRALITRTVDQLLDYDPQDNPTGIPLYMTSAVGEIDLRVPPVRLVTQVNVRDPFRVETLVAPAVYKLMTVNDPYTKLIVTLGNVWPGILSDLESIRITTICGYATKITGIDTSVSPLAGTISVSNGNPYTNGDVFRISSSLGDIGDPLPVLPVGLAYDTNYLVINVSGNSFQLTDILGNPITISTAGTGKLYAGEIPKNLLRAVMITAVKDFLGDESDETSTDSDSSGLPKRARDLCSPYKRIWL